MDNDRKRILIVEDDEEMRSLLKDFFEAERYKADSVSNGSEAFRKLVKEPFDLIITDIRMPGFNGLDILPGLKKLLPKIPVIVITAFGGEEVHREAYEKWVHFYLQKSWETEGLKGLIKNF